MRKLMIVLAAVALATPAMSRVIPEGTHEVGFAGSLDTESAQGTDVTFAIKYGVYIADQWVIGGAFGVGDNDIATNYEVGLYSEYNWDMEGDWVPYVGLDALWAGTDLDALDDTLDGAVVTPNLGLKYFFNPSVAGFGQVNYSIASDDIYTDNEGNLEDQNVGFVVGLRVYLGQ